jgi:hypothetical protein
MDESTLQLAATILTGALGATWVINGFLLPISGKWKRQQLDHEREENQVGAIDEFQLSHFGPWAYGEGQRGASRYEYGGWILGRTIYLTRRDHGLEELVEQGFPRDIAEKRNGQIQAKLRLRLVSRYHLEGWFVPRKVEFTRNPPRVIAVIDLKPEERSYRRVEPAKTVVSNRENAPGRV